MNEQPLRDKLERLHAQLEQAETADESAQRARRELMTGIQDVLQRPDDPARQYRSLSARLQHAVMQLEATHPHLTLLIGEVADELAQMGF